MKRLHLILLIYILLYQSSIANTCDSLVIAVKSSNGNWIGNTVSTYRNGLLYQIEYPNNNISYYSYDSLNRIIEIRDSLTKTVYNYTYDGKDSLITNYIFDGATFRITLQKVHEYYINRIDSLFSIYYYDNLLNISRKDIYQYTTAGKDSIFTVYIFDGINFNIYQQTVYEYYSNLIDSVTTYFTFDNFPDKQVKQFNLNGKDSINTSYFFNGSVFYLNSRTLFSYDVNGNLFNTVLQSFDTLIQVWDTSNIYHSNYSTDSLTRIDSMYLYPNTIAFGYLTLIVDSLGRTLQNSYRTPQTWGGTYVAYDAICTENISINYNESITPGPFGNSYSDEDDWTYDSLCRPIKLIHNSINAHLSHITQTDYYYADCNHIAITGLDLFITCSDQPEVPHVTVYGGNGPYSFLWTPNDSLSPDTVLNPTIYSNDGTLYHLTVNDSVGNTSQFQIYFARNYFTDTITDASCSNCWDGSVKLLFIGSHPVYNFSVTPNMGMWNGNILSGLPIGDYFICSHFSSCSYCDSIHIASPISVEEIDRDNIIRIYPNPAVKNIFVSMKQEFFNSRLEWKLLDLQGRIIKEGSETQNIFEISAEEIIPGIYTIEFISKQRSFFKLIVN